MKMTKSRIASLNATTLAFATSFVGALGMGGCDSCNSSTGVGADAGEDAAKHPEGGTHADARPDGKADGKADAKGTKDTGVDATEGGATTCSKHLPAGFSQAVVSNGVTGVLTGASGTRAAAMLLDENDDPMFAFASADSTASWSIQFTRWDPCAGQFTAPITVDTEHGGGPADVSIAYDSTTKEVGIAYAKPATTNDWADAFGEIWLGTMKAPATAFTVQPLTVGSTDDNSAGSPSIAMTGGHIYIALWDGPYSFSFPGLVLFLSSTTTPSLPSTIPPTAVLDGGAGDGAIAINDDAGPDAGPAPPHYFTYEAMPYHGGSEGYANPLGNPASISVAVDSTGAPAVAAYQGDDNYGKEVLFWRPGTPAVEAYVFAVDNGVDVSLAFEGTKPRIAGHMVIPTLDAGAVLPDSLIFLSSNDGVTWTPPVNLPSDNGMVATAFTSALALDGMGHAAVVADINGTTDNGCGGNPYLATSADEDDGGALWTACGADTTDVHQYSSYSASAAFGASRLKGKLTASFVSNASLVTDAGADQGGIIYWQAP
jgi:hypothetical protein